MKNAVGKSKQINTKWRIVCVKTVVNGIIKCCVLSMKHIFILTYVCMYVDLHTSMRYMVVDCVCCGQLSCLRIYPKEKSIENSALGH